MVFFKKAQGIKYPMNIKLTLYQVLFIGTCLCKQKIFIHVPNLEGTCVGIYEVLLTCIHFPFDKIPYEHQ